MTQTEALKLALEALDKYGFAPCDKEEDWQGFKRAITAIKEALAQPEQEPVAWAENDGDGNVLWNRDSCFSDDPEWLDNPMPLYTTPPQRTWVGLTNDDWDGIFGDAMTIGEAIKVTEAKLKEKNT